MSMRDQLNARLVDRQGSLSVALLCVALLAGCTPTSDGEQTPSQEEAAEVTEPEGEAPGSTGDEEEAAEEGGTQPKESAEEPEPEGNVRVLEHAAASEWELGERVLEALKEKDVKALEALRITEKEYKELLFPEFPAAQSKNIPMDFHWWHLDVRSKVGVQEAVHEFGGLDLELLEVIPTRGIDPYDSFEIWSKVELKVRLPNGREEQIKVFGSVIHLDGQWKILAFPT